MKKTRWHYLDAIKTLAMACVCMYHFLWRPDTAFVDPMSAGMLAERFFWCMNSVCVPLFMMVNGALLLNRRFDARKHFAHWGFMIAGMYAWFVITLAAVHAWRHGLDYVLGHWTGILNSAIYLYGYDGVTLNHLWFIQMLIALYMLFPLIHAAFNSADMQIQKALGISMTALAAVSFLPHDFELVNAYLPALRGISLGAVQSMNPARSGVYGAMLVYFVLGGYMHRHMQQIHKVKMSSCLILFAAGAVMIFAQWLLMTRKNEAVYDIVYNGYHCLGTLMMSAALFAAAAKLEPVFARIGRCKAVLGLIGRNTMAVYYLHWIAGLTICGKASGSFVSGIVFTAVLLVICSLLGEGLRRIPVFRRLV